jgi:hypothetical protein
MTKKIDKIINRIKNAFINGIFWAGLIGGAFIITLLFSRINPEVTHEQLFEFMQVFIINIPIIAFIIGFIYKLISYK